MRRIIVLSPIPVALTALAVPLAGAERPTAVCARVGTDDTPRAIPEGLVAAVNAVFGTRMPVKVAVATTVFRCADGHVLVCTTGANLPCGAADTSRTPGPGAVEWCRTRPSADFIPAFATGHSTIYAWRCENGQARIVRQLQGVDPRGFVARYWKRLS
jgi:hypothetical protein